MRNLILTFVTIWLFFHAIEYSEIWDQRANPKPNVTIELESGEYTGKLTRDWNKNNILILDDGRRIVFNSFKSISHPMPKPHEVEHFKWLGKHWRRNVPLILLTLALSAIAVSTLRPRNKQTQQN